MYDIIGYSFFDAVILEPKGNIRLETKGNIL